MKRLRWKKNLRETGLASVCSGPRGSKYHDGRLVYATVSASIERFQVNGWYWVAGWDSGVPYKNTCFDLCETEDEAKKQASAYVKKHLLGGRD